MVEKRKGRSHEKSTAMEEDQDGEFFMGLGEFRKVEVSRHGRVLGDDNVFG